MTLTTLLNCFKAKVSPRHFVWIATLISGIWFLALYPTLNWIYPNSPALAKMSTHTRGIDFEQYYAGAIVAKYGLWEHLYPTPDPKIYDVPPKFKPEWETRFFDKNKINGNPIYYHQVAEAGVSYYSKELLDICPELQKAYHYIYPPPLALLLRPLACFKFETAADLIWPALSMFALFGTSFFSSRIHRLLCGGVSYAEGFVLLAYLFFSIDEGKPLQCENATPILGFLITFSTYAWLRGWQTVVGMAMIPLLLFKGIGVTWCPILFLRRIQWKTLTVLAAITITLNGMTLYLAGAKIYTHYYYDILPKAVIPLGIGIAGKTLTTFGVYPRSFFLVCTLVLLAGIYYGYWRACSRNPSIRDPAVIPATIAATLAVFCSLNTIVWIHYFPNYVYFPFLGWILWEGFQAKGGWQRFIFTSTALLFLGMDGYCLYRFSTTVWVCPVFLFSINYWASWACHAVLGPGFILILASRRLFLFSSQLTKRVCPRGQERVLA